MRNQSGLFGRFGIAIALASVLSALPTLDAAASDASAVSTADDAGSGSAAETAPGEGSVTPVQERLDISSSPGPVMALWTWSKGHRAYTISRFLDSNPVNVTPEMFNHMTVVSHDLDSLREVNRVKLPHLYAGPAPDDPSKLQMASRITTAAVDEDRGRLYIAHNGVWRGTAAGGAGYGHPAVEAATRGGLCAPSGRFASTCLAGIYVLDAASLEVSRRFDIGEITVDGSPILAPELISMEYSPPRSPEDSGKLHLLITDRLFSDGAYDASIIVESPGDYGAGVMYAMQVDPDLGVVDWVVRVDGCRGRQRRRVNTGGSDRGPDTHRTGRGTIFRAPSIADPAVWAGCHNTGQTAAIVRIPLDARGFPAVLPARPGEPGAIADAVGEGGPTAVDRDQLVSQDPGAQQVFPGPRFAVEMTADPTSERLLLRVIDGNPLAEVWWVFDGRKGAFVGTVGIGRFDRNHTMWGVDRTVGRLYVMAPDRDGGKVAGGLFVTDLRRTPLPQALQFRAFAGKVDANTNQAPIAVDTSRVADGGPRRLLFRPGQIYREAAGTFTPPPPAFLIAEDTLPAASDPVVDLFAGRSVDLDEVAGVTQANFDGAARGYAARMLVVGGVESVGRAGPVDSSYSEKDPGGTIAVQRLPYSECARTNRQVVLGFVGPRDAAVVDGNGSRGGAEAVVVDSATRSDSELPYSRCSLRGETQLLKDQGNVRADLTDNLDWDKVWGTGLFSRPPVGEPSVPWQFGDGDVSCVSSDEEPSASFGDPVTGLFASRVECGAEEASGYGYARGVGVDGLNVSEAVSKFRIYRDPGRGIVSRVESIARGIDIGGQIRIDTVRGVAESWANGRAQFVADADRDKGYDPNCDFERTAGTCFSRSIFGVKTPVYSCGPCGDEQALVDGLSKALGANGRVRLRDPDETLRKGAPNGYLAAIQKPAHERFGDVVLNDDLLQTTVPVLEIVRYTTPGAGITSNRRGLQVYQFAGVEVSSSYGIQCLLVFDAAANTCGAEAVVPGGITVSLTDGDGRGLAGGGFEVRQDVDADGVVGLKDTLLPDGACVTADDGVGTCRFEGLQPGSYLVSQVAAPAGFGKVAEAFVVELASGEARTVTFVNSSSVSTINVSAADEAGKPVSGAVFAVYADPDADGKVAADAQPAATCTTDASGGCSMGVPAGSYVLVQTGAPGGLEPIDPVAFTFASGGQTAAVGVVNYPAGGLPQPQAAAAPVYSDAPAASVTETVTDYAPVDAPVVDAPVSVPQVVGGTIVRVIQAPGDALRLLSRDPKQAAAWTASLLLFALAYLAIRRRNQAIALMEP